MNKKQICIAASLATISAFGATLGINIDCSRPTADLSPHLYGLFFEDINYAADGGLYAELVQNRSFEYYQIKDAKMPPLFAWEKIERGTGSCTLSIEDRKPLNDRNTNYLTINIRKPGQVGISNSGFDGIPLDKDANYDLSLYARSSNWNGSSTLTVALELADGTVCGKTEFSGISNDWKKLEGVISANKTTDNARLVITTEGSGTLDLDMVSLFPQDTFMGRKNGMRKDLAQALKDLNPKFLRFPGGCIAHGDGLDNVYHWKDTVGDIAERKPNWNRWGYHQTYGLGYYEYFQLCEDLGATALPVVPLGVSCGFNPPQECVPMGELGPWIQDALDLIEFANGSVSTKWGSLRAQMGHPEPFNLEFICLGNEPHDNALFRDRFPPFVEAIREQYPEIKIIGTSGLGPEIPIYDLMTEQNVYSSDEHYYMSPDWFINNSDRFDNFDREKPLIFVGEYAAHDVDRVNTLYSALSEAAFLTGVERNGDIVDMTCYAPLFGHRHHTQWKPDLIYFDHRNVIKTANYYVQQLFARNKGDVSLASEVKLIKEELPRTPSGRVGIGTWHTTIEIDSAAVNGKKVNPAKWTALSGSFELKEGRYAQTDVETEPAISLSSKTFDDDTITYTLRARKTGGREGFLIVFGRGEDKSNFWWNIAGWGNTQHALQYGTENNVSIVTQTPGRIENNRWYDIKVVLGNGKVKCYLDNQLIHDYDLPRPRPAITAALAKASGEIIVKLVNPTPEVFDSVVQLQGTKNVHAEAKRILLTGDRNAHNSFGNPDAVKPIVDTTSVGRSFKCTLPAMSVQFIRIKADLK